MGGGGWHSSVWQSRGGRRAPRGSSLCNGSKVHARTLLLAGASTTTPATSSPRILGSHMGRGRPWEDGGRGVGHT